MTPSAANAPANKEFLARYVQTMAIDHPVSIGSYEYVFRDAISAARPISTSPMLDASSAIAISTDR